MRELWDLGERTVDGWRGLAVVREAVRAALVLAVAGAGAAVVAVTALARFFVMGRSCEGAVFSLSSAVLKSVEMCSLYGALVLSSSRYCTASVTYLVLFTVFFGLSSSSTCFTVCVSFTGTADAGFGSVFSACSSNRSWIFLFLNAVGIRLTRISNRERRP